MVLSKSSIYGALLLSAISVCSGETIQIGAGYQSTCIDTYIAGVIVKELRLLEKFLPRTGKCQGVDYSIDWQDYTSGPPITQRMLSNKIQFGVMGDYPLIVNGARFQETDSLRSLYIAGTGYKLRGSGNAIVVPIKSKIRTFSDLVGKEISMPVGSSAWGMTLKGVCRSRYKVRGCFNCQSKPNDWKQQVRMKMVIG